MVLKQVLAALVHLGAFSLYAYSIYFDYEVIADNMPLWKTFGGRWKFLTWWNVCFQTFFFALSVIIDLYGNPSNVEPKTNEDQRGVLEKFRDHYLISIAWPMGTFVVLTFWAIYFIDRQLVYPEYLDEIIPAWHNHTYHTFVLLFLMAEMVLVYHRVPKRKNGLAMTFLFSLAYLFIVFFVAFYADFWVYPILEVLSWPGRLGFIGGLLVFLTLIYVIGENITFAVWGEPDYLIKKKE